MVRLVTFYSPRPSHEKFIDYIPLLQLQQRTAARFGHEHVVVSDVDLPGLNVWCPPQPLPESLMKAIMVGQLSYLNNWVKEANPKKLVLVDGDCLVHRDLSAAFDGTFDLALTSRTPHRSPINNGVMYADNQDRQGVVNFFEHALANCEDHWGGDQEAISGAAAPVPEEHGVVKIRQGIRVKFVSLETHAVVPTQAGMRHKRDPFMVHFKGEKAKEWMELYATKFIL
jgi:hypothetical protein